ncbi:predicted protein [Arabidopsis lyrata subsp. lyrata]|uniref:Predicted protein n=1 Tax=Arabidopsis lyrata subsp. lyrata TaxID=81972 RepID=D7M1J3_ARALL|nr:predicted protein [Arabidopsis lyrata subsp. lyrata]
MAKAVPEVSRRTSSSIITRRSTSHELPLSHMAKAVPEVSRRTSSSIITRRSASHELPILKALQSVAKKHKRGVCGLKPREELHENLKNMVGLLKLPEENKNLFKAKVRLWLEMLIKKCGMKKAVKSGKPKETYETPEKQERFKYIQNQSLLEVDESDDEPLDTKQDQLFEQEFDVEELLSCSGLRYWLKNAVKSGKPKEHMKLLKNTKDICVMPYILSSLGSS